MLFKKVISCPRLKQKVFFVDLCYPYLTKISTSLPPYATSVCIRGLKHMAHGHFVQPAMLFGNFQIINIYRIFQTIRHSIKN